MIGGTWPYLELLIWALFSVLGIPIIGKRLISKLNSICQLTADTTYKLLHYYHTHVQPKRNF